MSANKDGLTLDDLSEIVVEKERRIKELAEELVKEKRNHARALKRATLWKGQLREAKAQLKYETRSVEKLERRTRRKINV